MPPTEVQLGSGTIVSPCPPSSMRRDVLDADAQFHRQERAEAGRIEHAGLAHHALRRKAGHLPGPLHHRIQRIADHDDDRPRGWSA